MKQKHLFTVVCLLGFMSIALQAQNLIVHPTISLPQDSMQAKELIRCLNQFLLAARNANTENPLVFPSEKIETFVLLDEINGIEKSGRFKDDFFYKPYLINVIQNDEKDFVLQVAYIGVHENQAYQRAIFELVAHPSPQGFLFSSPLINATKSWKIARIENNIFHYKDSLNRQKAAEYAQNAALFDSKLQSKDKITEFYCCKDFKELQQLIGMMYKSDYNGETQNTVSSTLDNKLLIITGEHSESFDKFDLHDLWHNRLSLVISRSLVNKPIDEACAYLYGGSWGMTWEEILQEFKLKVASNKATDWQYIKENSLDFGKSDAEHLMADYVVNALIVNKLEKEKGFSAVWELLNCGKYEKGNENYYKVLEKLTGITKANYNEKIWELVNKQ